MKLFSKYISVFCNKRGVWDIDTIKGCNNAINGGCYGVCYALKIARSKGYDFTTTINRDFRDTQHFNHIVNSIRGVTFVRIGVMGDPSYDWDHTLNIISKIRPFNKDIVIITKHWKELPENRLKELNGLVINTSISALDDDETTEKRLYWFNKLKKYCKSILRVNTADFNDIYLKEKQIKLLNNDNVIDNILRIPKNHILAENGIINVTKQWFLGSHVYVSRHDSKVYFGFCDKCPDKCGVKCKQKKILDFI